MRRQPARIPRFSGVGLLLLTLAAGSPAQEETPTQYEGRVLAQPMSYRGAPWLEREGREEEEQSAALLAKMALEPGQKVADIGCGSGFYSRRMAAQVAPDGTVFAVDIQPEMLRILRDLAARDGHRNIVTVLGEDGDPHLPEEEIDWVLLVDVYHEFQDPAAMLEEIHRSLSAGGRVALVEYRLEGDSARHIKLDHRMSVEQVRKEWEPAGFQLLELWEELPSQHLFIFGKAP